jgi:ribosomal-protein-alanine N-acetyltransferase
MPSQPLSRLPAGWQVEPIDIARDLDLVMAVDAASFPNPWTRAMFLHEAEGSEVGALLVLRSAEGHVAGYCACWVVAGELHINNIAVGPAWRGRGLGSALLGAVLDRARGLGATRATLEVRSSNAVALALYRRFGFEVVSVRRGYYHNPDDDGLILWKRELEPP